MTLTAPDVTFGRLMVVLSDLSATFLDLVLFTLGASIGVMIIVSVFLEIQRAIRGMR